MTDYYDVPTIFTGDWIDAAWINQYIGDNFRAFKQGFVNGGDVPYALDGNTLAALAKPVSADSFYKMQTSGVPVYVPKTQLPGALHTMGLNYSDSNPNTTSTSFVSAGISLNLTLTVPCTIIAWASGSGRKNSGSAEGRFVIEIDGTIDANEPCTLQATVPTPFSTIFRRTGIAAGTRNVVLKYRTLSGSDALYCTRGVLYALAFVDA